MDAVALVGYFFGKKRN